MLKRMLLLLLIALCLAIVAYPSPAGAAPSTPVDTTYCRVSADKEIGQLVNQSVGVCGNVAAATAIDIGGNKRGEFVGPVNDVKLFINGSRHGRNPGHSLGTEKAVLYGPEGGRIELIVNQMNTFNLPAGKWGLGPYSSAPEREKVCAPGLLDPPAKWPAGICFNEAMLKAADPETPGKLVGPVNGGVIWLHPDARHTGYDHTKPLALHGNKDGKYSPISLKLNEWNWLDLPAGAWGLGNVEQPRDYCGEVGLTQVPNWPAGVCGNAELLKYADPNSVGEFTGPSVKGQGLALYLHPDAVTHHGYTGQLALHQIGKGVKYSRIDIVPAPGWTWFEFGPGRWGLGGI